MGDNQLDTLQILLIIIIPSLIAGVPAIISAIAAWRDKRKRISESLNNEGSAAEKVSNAWEKLSKDLQFRIDKMEVRFDKAELDTDIRQKAWVTKQMEMENSLEKQGRRIRFLMKGICQLINQIEELGAIPLFKLSEDDINEINNH